MCEFLVTMVTSWMLDRSPKLRKKEVALIQTELDSVCFVRRSLYRPFSRVIC